MHGNGSELGVCKGVKPVRGTLVVRGKDQDSTYTRDMILFGNEPTTARTPNDSGLVHIWHPSSRASQPRSACRANSRFCTYFPGAPASHRPRCVMLDTPTHVRQHLH